MKKSIYIFLLIVALAACKNQEPVAKGYQGQGKSAVVSTLSKPVQKQWKGIWTFDDEATFFNNS